MSFLAPLFLAGAAVIAVPLYLHLLRRRTRREVPFGSLLFLRQTPPRFDSRRRLEHLALLALRCLVVAALALAFARPFFGRQMPAISSGGGERWVVLVDASASMRQGWDRARDEAARILRGRAPADRVAVFTFDGRPRPLLTFEDWEGLPIDRRSAEAEARLAARGPGWGSTDLGRALVAAADAIEDDRTALGGRAGPGRSKILLVSDLARGSRLEMAEAWPPGLELVTAPVQAAPGNAGLAALASIDADGEGDGAVRVRVTNSEDAKTDQFVVAAAGKSQEITVPAGQSRAVSLPVAIGRQGLVVELRGDGQAFDDRVHVAPPLAVDARVLYVGGDEALYFVSRAFPRTPLRNVDVVVRRPGDADIAAEAGQAHLIVVTAPLGGGVEGLRPALARGRTVVMAPAVAADVGRLAGSLSVRDPEGDRYATITEVDTTHPALAPFADPRFSDFGKVRFWKRRQMESSAVRVVARFDDGSSAWLAVPVERGQLFLMASALTPVESQLVLSSKFVPLLHALLETSAGIESGRSQYFVGDAVALPKGKVEHPDTPGVYTVEGRTFAVNVPPAESLTTPLPPETFERFAGTRVDAGPQPPAAIRRAHDERLEAEQALRRPLLAGLLALLVFETWFASRRREVAA